MILPMQQDLFLVLLFLLFFDRWIQKHFLLHKAVVSLDSCQLDSNHDLH